MKWFISTLPRTIIRSFMGRNMIWHLLAIAITYMLVVTNIDWLYFIYNRNDDHLLLVLLSLALGIGAIVPLFVPLILIVSGHISKREETLAVGWLLAQAALLGSFVSSFYKAFTGRLPPNTHDLVDNVSNGFNFGFMQHGIFWGWPSSHTTIAFAMACAFIFTFPKKRLYVALALLYAFYIGIGVSVSVHWLSDFIAGAIIGSVIGVVVGNNFKEYPIRSAMPR